MRYGLRDALSLRKLGKFGCNLGTLTNSCMVFRDSTAAPEQNLQLRELRIKGKI